MKKLETRSSIRRTESLIERCQCQLNRLQRNHIASAMLVWLSFKELAYKVKQTVYQLKQGLLSDYLKYRLRIPTIIFN